MSMQFSSQYDNEILTVFLEEISGYLPELEAELNKLDRKPKDKDALEVAHRLAHTIKGTAASLGFDEVSKHGLFLEQALTPVLEKKAVFNPELTKICQSHLADLKKLLGQLQAEANKSQLTEQAAYSTAVEANVAKIVPNADVNANVKNGNFELLGGEESDLPVVSNPSDLKETYSGSQSETNTFANFLQSSPGNEELPDIQSAHTQKSPDLAEDSSKTTFAGWLDDAAELFSFNDLQPSEFIQKLEERQQLQAAEIESKTDNSTPAQEMSEHSTIELPDWLLDFEPNQDHEQEPPAHFDTPFLNMAGVPESESRNYDELDLPSMDNFEQISQLAAFEGTEQKIEPLLPPLPLDVSSPASLATGEESETPWPDYDFNFANLNSESQENLKLDLTSDDLAAIDAHLAHLSDLDKTSDQESKMEIDENFDFPAFSEMGFENDFADEEEGFGFDVAPMWLAEGHVEIQRLGEILNSRNFEQNLSEVAQTSSTLRKAAELMELTEISNQLRVIEITAGMVLSGDLPADNKSSSMLIGAYNELLRLLEPYQDAAQNILSPVATTSKPESDFQIQEAAEVSKVTPSASVDKATNSHANEETTYSTQNPPAGVDIDKELAEVFASEAEEHIQVLDSRLAALEKEPHNLEHIREIRRTAHTLKGSAAMVGYNVISQTGHLMEDLLDKLYDGSIDINSSIVELLFGTFNFIEKMVRDIAVGGAEDPALLGDLRSRYEAVLESGAEEAAGGAIIFEPKGSQTVVSREADQVRDGSFAAEKAPGLDMSEPYAGTVNPSLDMELGIRVPISRLDGMMNQVGELVINRTVLEQRNQVFNRAVEEMSLAVRRLQKISRELETRYEVELLKSSNVGAGVPVGAGVNNRNGYGNYNVLDDISRFDAEFDTLEMDRYTEFHTLSREMSETVSDLATLQRDLDNLRDDMDNVSVQQSRLTDDLQDRLVKIRLVPLSNLTPRLYRTVRTIAASQNKEIEFVVSGDTTEVDKTIFEEIVDPLLHLIRNAVDHGIETPEKRKASGKNPVATIGFAANSEGSDVVIKVSDDGRGIDIEQLRQRGVERGFLRSDAKYSDEDIYNLMFLPGFSTSETISEVSGRGVGLDVVKANILLLKGSIEISSEVGRGTTFLIRLPNTLAITKALLVKAAGYVYAIPLNVIEETGRLEQGLVFGSDDNQANYYRYNGKMLPLYKLSEMLVLPGHAVRNLDFMADDENASTLKRERPVLIIGGTQPYALMVDELAGQQEVVVKSLGTHLKMMRGLAGATILGSGQVILILNVYELLGHSTFRPSNGFASGTIRSTNQLLKFEAGKVLTEAEIQERELAEIRGRDFTPALVPPTSPKVRRVPVVQVVDDSLSIRKVLSIALEKAGFRVRTSKDGQEAWEAIQQSSPDLILMDIEMPRMDGYQLTSILKNDTRYQNIPVVMLTSRAGLKHRQKAEEVGANGFLVKPYKEEELLGLIGQLMAHN